MMRYSAPSIVDLHLAAGVLAEEDTVALLDGEREPLALVGHLAGADRDALPSWGLSLAVSGMMMLPCFSSCSSMRLMRTRS